MFSTNEDVSVDDALQSRGMYDLIPEMDDVQAIAGFTFGGRKNSGALLMGPRGNLIGKASVDGRETSSEIHYPFSEGTGYFRGPYQDTIVRYPIAGQAGDDNTYGMMFSTDTVTGKPIAAVVSPRQYDKEGLIAWGPDVYAYGTPIHYQVCELAQKNDIGRALSNSFDSFYIYNNSGVRYVKIATITNPNNAANASFAAAIVIGNWGSYSQRTYMLNVNAQNAASQTVSIDNIQQWVQFTCVHGRRNNRVMDSNLFPSVGLVQTKSTGVFEIYLRVPTNAKLLSCTTINCGDSSLINFNWTALVTRYTDLPSTVPTGIVFGNTAFPYTSNDTIMLNDGSLTLWENGHVLRVGASNISTRRGDFLQSPFVAGSNLHAHSNSSSGLASITVVANGNNTYTVTGCTINWTSFRLKAPVGFPSQSGGTRKQDYVVIFDSYDATNKTFTFSVRTVGYAGTYDSTTGKVTISESLSDPIAIPEYTWVDFNITV